MIISYVLQVTLCLAFFYALYYAVLQKETLFRTNRIYLLGTLIASLILPLVRIYILDHQHEVSIVTAPIYVGSYLENMNEVIVAPPHNTFPWLGALTAVYKGIVLFLVCRILESVLSILRMQKIGEKVILYGQQCVLSPNVKSPFSFFSTIYLPKDHQFSESELEEIMTHEKTHVLGRHTLDVLLVELICCGMWLSPMVYLYRKKIREVHEFLADAEVLKNTPWENYASFLLAQKNEGLQQRLSNQLIYSQLKNRLIMMNKERSFQSAKYKYLAIIPILAFTLVIFSFREKSIPGIIQPRQGDHVLNIHEDGLKIYTAMDSIWSADPLTPHNDSSILVITEDKRYFLNHKEIKFELLEQALSITLKDHTERMIFLRISQKLTVQDLVDILNLTQKLNIKVVLEKPSSYVDRTIYISHDTMPTTYIVSVRTTERSGDADKYNENKVDEPYTYVEEMPSFPDGMEAMYKYISQQIKYPEVAFENRISGQVIVRFVVSREGDIRHANVVRGIGGGCDEEALRVVNSMPRWKPGKNKGLFVPVTFTLPIRFVWQEKLITQDEKNTQDEVFTFVEEMPHFPGSSEEMFKYIYQSIKYPQEERAQGNEGMVVVQFIVEPDGAISNAKVLRGISRGLNEEALRVIKSMNDLPEKWTPGHHEGKAVPVSFTLPFKFVLQQEQKLVPKKVETAGENSDSKIDTEQTRMFSVSPSPADDVIKIEFTIHVQAASIYDGTGRVIWQKKFQKEEIFILSIDISKWNPGTYTVQSIADAQTYSSSFIVQH